MPAFWIAGIFARLRTGSPRSAMPAGNQRSIDKLTKMWYLYFLAFAFVEMLCEVRISAGNSRRLIAQGAVEVRPDLLSVMAVIYFLVFVGSAIEFTMHPERWNTYVAGIFLLLYLLAKALKLWTVKTLGPCWTMRVLIIPGSEVITAGPYRWIKHPNYVAVLAELAAIPLAGGAWITFLLTFCSFMVVLNSRIRSEETALVKNTNYSDVMAHRSRFIPGGF